MLFLSRVTDLILLALVLVGKEILFAGEERLIVVSYVFLFIVLYFLLSSVISSDFEYRSNVIKEEIEAIFLSIATIIVKTKKLILTSNFIYIRLIKLYRALVLEYYYNVYYNFNFSQFKLLFLNFKISQMLVSSLNFVMKLNSLLKKNYMLALHNFNIGWLASNEVLWNRVVRKGKVKTKAKARTKVKASRRLISAESKLESERKLLEKQRPWFITMEEWFSLKSNFKYKYLFESKDFKYSIYNSFK